MHSGGSTTDPVALLADMLGPGAAFRNGQREAIEAIVEDSARVLVVQRTGWGKSLVYWIATRIRRDRGSGPTLIISPLLSLMRNQIEMAARLGIRAATIHSGNRDEWQAVEASLEADAVDVLLISPERLANEEFALRILPAIQGSIGMLVIDEAHCISDWGHDFRPDYRRIGRIIRLIAPGVPILGTTATANDRVIADVVEQFGDRVTVIRGPLARDTLRLDAIALADQAERMAWLAEQIPRLPGSGIIYTLTVADSERVAAWLRSRGIDARPYNGQMATEEREALEAALVANEPKALVATVALGMGFDKPDLGFVVHFQRPGSAIAYYQQVGRAGRAVDRAYGILLSGREDDEIADYFIRTAFPPTARMEEILSALESVESATLGQLLRMVNVPRGQVDQALKLLEIDGAVAKVGSRYTRTPTPWRQDEVRIARVVATRRAELHDMRAYLSHDGCRMEYLVRLLDDPEPRPCGRCNNDVGRGLPRDVDAAIVQDAVTFLRRDLRPIGPKRRWPPDAVEGLSGSIDPPNEAGIALSIYGDAGWGRAVADGKYRHGGYSDALVIAAAAAIRDRWKPDPRPEWVTAIPSAKRGLVGDFAAALARELGLPYAECLIVIAAAAPQKEMENSAQQLRNVRAKLSVDEPSVLDGPVLLVDDITDSGWTLTYAGSLLRNAGSGAVLPFALAAAARGSG